MGGIPAYNGRTVPLGFKLRFLLSVSQLVFGKSFYGLSVDEARRRLRRMTPPARKPTRVGNVTDRTIPGPASEIPIRIYAPVGAGPFPLLVYFHGSGFVLADLDTEDESCRALCKSVESIVVSVDYRLAPENKFPAAPDDCLAATRWVAMHAAELNGDPSRIAVAGDSAGGNLATVTALRIRDEGGPRLCGQALIYPVTAFHTPPTPSCLENADGYGLTRADMIWFWSHYLGDKSDSTNPYAAPLLAPDLRGLPPTLVITAEYDPLRDEGERYAERLRAAGVPVALSRYTAVHGFLHFRRIFKEGRMAFDETTNWLRRTFFGTEGTHRSGRPE